jgi:hypothetical protein
VKLLGNKSTKMNNLIMEDFYKFNEVIVMNQKFILSGFEIDPESKEYAACSLRLNDFSVLFRSAKITPTKIGQFVTLWKRNAEGITAPFHIADDIDFAIICTRTPTHFGVFIFPKSVLNQKGIFANDKKDGKRGFRVYPPWDIAENKQAKQSQEWQLEYFFDLNIPIEIEKIKVMINFKGKN